MAKSRVRKILEKPSEEAPSSVRVRWVLVRTNSAAFVHAIVVGQSSTLCRGHMVEGALYPPAADIPHCPACTEEIARLDVARKKAAEHA